ncbi:hypothetical protein ACHQM5_002523 [Ranunculus cassubicifolius]
MASWRNLTLLILLYLSFWPLQSESWNGRKLMAGSKPPLCVNQCFGCKPCTATLVSVKPHENFKLHHNGADSSYYPVSWRCTCGHKLYHP